MKTPLKNPASHLSTLAELKKIITPGKVVNSFFFYCGAIELSLSASDRFVVGHPNALAVHEFWECLLQNSDLVHEIVVSGPFSKLRHERIITLLQEKWATYPDPYVRAALFYTLNQYSQSGKISSGILEDNPLLFNKWKLNNLKKFKCNNFHLANHFEASALESVVGASQGDYRLYNLGNYRSSLLTRTQAKAIEESSIDHSMVHHFFDKSIEIPSILLYKFHPRVLKLYKHHHLRLIGKHGQIVRQFNDCEDIIVTNF